MSVLREGSDEPPPTSEVEVDHLLAFPRSPTAIAMLNPQLLSHLEAYEDANDEDRATGTASSSSSSSALASDAKEEQRVEPPAHHRTCCALHLLHVPTRRLTVHASFNHLRHLLSSSAAVSRIHVETVALLGASILFVAVELRTRDLLTFGVAHCRQLCLLWEIVVAFSLIWSLRKATCSKGADDEPVCDTTEGRISECRRELSTLLASVGAPPLMPLPHWKDDVLSDGDMDVDARTSTGQLTNDVPDDHEDIHRDLDLLECFTRRNVALLHRLDDITDWIRDATTLRIVGTPRASTFGARHRGGLSVERVERSAASRLLSRLHYSRSEDADDVTSCDSTHQPSPSQVSTSFDSLPLSSLRRNVAAVGLQQLQALCVCLSVECDTADENELDDETYKCQVEPPPVVTLSWLRSLRNDLVHVLHNAVEETTRDLLERTRQTRDGCGGAPNVAHARWRGSAMRRAVAVAEEGLSYLEAYPQIGLYPVSTKPAGVDCEMDMSIDVSNELSELQHQSDALITALLALQESLGSSPCTQETRCWWDTTRDLSSRVLAGVEALGEELLLNREDGSSPASKSSISTGDSPDDGFLRQTEPACVTEYVLVDSSYEERKELEDDEGPSASNRWASKTLVYSGHGSQIRTVKKRARPSSERKCSARGNRHAQEPIMCYRSLFDELRSRLDLIHAEEVEADVSFITTSISDNDGPKPAPVEANRRVPADNGEAPLIDGMEEIAAAFLEELRGALRDDVDGSDSSGDK